MLTELTDDQLATLLGKKPSFPVLLDLCSTQCKLTSDAFLEQCPNVLKELDLSGNRLVALERIDHLNKLKRLAAGNNQLEDVNLAHLAALEVLTLPYNSMKLFPRNLTSMKSLVSLDLSYNKLGECPEAAWADLGQLKALKALILANNKISMTIQEVHNTTLCFHDGRMDPVCEIKELLLFKLTFMLFNKYSFTRTF